MLLYDTSGSNVLVVVGVQIASRTSLTLPLNLNPVGSSSMAQNHSTPPVMPTTTSSELVQAQAELWCHTFAYLRSMALQSVIKIGIPTAIHRCGGGGASLSDLQLALPAVPPSKWPRLLRLMKLLVVSGIFREDEAGVNCLTPVSRLLVEEEEGGEGGGEGGHACHS